MPRATEWLIASAVLVVGVVLAGIAMVGTGISLIWEGYGTREGGGRAWWSWSLLVLPPALMVVAGLLARRAGASGPVALGGAGVVGVLVGVAYLVTAYLAER